MATHEARPEARAIADSFARLMQAIRASGYATPPDAMAEAQAIFYDEVARSGDLLEGLTDRLVPLFATSAASQGELRRQIAGAWNERPARTKAETETSRVSIRRGPWLCGLDVLDFGFPVPR